MDQYHIPLHCCPHLILLVHVLGDNQSPLSKVQRCLGYTHPCF